MAISFLLLFGLIFIAGLTGLVVLIGAAMNHPAFRVAAGVVVLMILLLGVPVVLVWSVHGRPMPTEPVSMGAVGSDGRGRQAADESPNNDADTHGELPPMVTELSEGDIPAWITRADTRWTDDGTYFARIDLGPMLREDYPELPDAPPPVTVEPHQLRQLLRAHPAQRAAFDEKVGHALREFARRATSHKVKRLPFSADEVIERLVAAVWMTEVRLTDRIPLEGDADEPSPTVAVHALLRIDQPARQEIVARAEEMVSRERAAGLILLGVMTLLLLGIVLAMLKLDLRTEGRYRGRLALAAAIGILVLLFGGVLLVMS